VLSQSHPSFSPDAPVFSDRSRGGGHADYDNDLYGNEFDDVDVRRVGTMIHQDRDEFYSSSDVGGGGSLNNGLNQSMALPANQNLATNTRPTRQALG